MAIINFFDRGWRINPDGAAYIQNERRYSFNEVGELSCRIANRLLRRVRDFAQVRAEGAITDAQKRGWLTKEQMREAIAICQSLPGPLAIQVGIYIAWLRCGFWGAWLGHNGDSVFSTADANGLATHGVPEAIDGAARQVLESRGFGPHFMHGTGHGLGLEVHESPRIGAAGTARSLAAQGAFSMPPPARVEPGMVFTIEPGAYLPGFGGVRIEDDVLVTAEGSEVLTTGDRALRVC